MAKPSFVGFLIGVLIAALIAGGMVVGLQHVFFGSHPPSWWKAIAVLIGAVFGSPGAMFGMYWKEWLKVAKIREEKLCQILKG